jgi:hypothetical protein
MYSCACRYGTIQLIVDTNKSQQKNINDCCKKDVADSGSYPCGMRLPLAPSPPYHTQMMRSLPLSLSIPRRCVLHYTRDRSYDCRRLSSTFTSTPPSSSTPPPLPERLDDDDAFRGEKCCNRAGTWYFKKLRVIAKTLSSEDEEGILNGGRHASGEL